MVIIVFHEASHLLGATRAVRRDSSRAPASANCLLLYSLWNSRYLPTTLITHFNKDTFCWHMINCNVSG